MDPSSAACAPRRPRVLRMTADASARDQQVLGEAPFFVDPLRFATETRVLGDVGDFVSGIFVAAFCPDGFTRLQRDRELGGGNVYRLFAVGQDVHFHAAGYPVEFGDVFELGKVEVGVELAIHAGQQVEIEGGGDSQRVVIGRQQLGHGLLQVGAEEQR